MSDLENDLKRVLHQKADGDYLTGPEEMLGRVGKGAVRLYRRRVAALLLSTLAVVTAGTTLALNAGDLTKTDAPVVTQTSTPTPGTTQNTAPPRVQPTGAQTTGNPPFGGLPSNSVSTPTTPATPPTVAPTTAPTDGASGVVVTEFQTRAVAARGGNTVRLVGSGKCNGVKCYPIMLSTDSGKTFRYEENAPGQASSLGIEGDNWWIQGGSERTIWQSHDAGKTWKMHHTPDVIRGVYGHDRGTPTLKLGTGNPVSTFYKGGGSPYFSKAEPGLTRAHDYSYSRRRVGSGDVNGMVGVVVANSDHKPRMTGCQTTSTDTQVSAGPGDVIWLMCPTADGPKLLLSLDTGMSWKTVPAKLPRLGGVNHLAAISAESVLFYTGPTSRATLVSSDGSTRETILTNMATPDEVYFQTPLVGYAQMGELVLRTSDGGRTWNKVDLRAFE